ncbi:MAG: addiction module protein [Verrucomicrobiales bacterium]
MTELEKLRSLPVAERLELVEDLWDSIAGESNSVGLSAAHLAELDRRLDRIEESPSEGTSWTTLRERILASL